MSRVTLSNEVCDKILERFSVSNTSTVTLSRDVVYTLIKFVYSLGLNRDAMKMKYKDQ